jgi:hypothetical protein
MQYPPTSLKERKRRIAEINEDRAERGLPPMK